MNTNTVIAGGSRLGKTICAPADATNMSADLTVTKFRFPAIANGVRGEKESALCAVWFAYQADLISEQEVIRQSVALATAADLEISAMRKEIESLKLGVDILSLDGRDGNKPTNL